MQEKDFVIVYLEESNRIILFTHVSFRNFQFKNATRLSTFIHVRKK